MFQPFSFGAGLWENEIVGDVRSMRTRTVWLAVCPEEFVTSQVTAVVPSAVIETGSQPSADFTPARGVEIDQLTSTWSAECQPLAFGSGDMIALTTGGGVFSASGAALEGPPTMFDGFDRFVFRFFLFFLCFFLFFLCFFLLRLFFFRFRFAAVFLRFMFFRRACVFGFFVEFQTEFRHDLHYFADDVRRRI